MAQMESDKIDRNRQLVRVFSTATLVAYTACMPNYDDLIYGRTQCNGSICPSIAGSGGVLSQGSSSATSTAGGDTGGITGTTGGSPTGGQGGRTNQTTVAPAAGGVASSPDPSCADNPAVTDSGSQVVRLFGSATADSEQKGHPANLATDCDLSTRWTAADDAAGHYWTLDMGASHLLSRIEIVWEYPKQALGGIYTYKVQVSDEDATYSLAIDKSANDQTTQTQVADFPSGSSGRYVRLIVESLPPPTSLGQVWAAAYEIRVFGS